MDVGKSIKELRQLHRLTQAQLGAAIGVSPMAVSQWENGRSVPRMGAIQRMADYFDVPKSSIMGDRMDEAEAQMVVDYSLQPANSTEIELIMCYRSMTPRFRALLLETARAYRDSGLAKNSEVSGTG